MTFLKGCEFISNVTFSRGPKYDVSKMYCISRTDYRDETLFVEENNRKRRYNLYSQIAVENDSLRCLNEVYDLTEVCNLKSGLQLCTLLDTNEVVNIGCNSNSHDW